MKSKAYRGTAVNDVNWSQLSRGREGQPFTVGVDVGKYELRAVLRWPDGEFERPWKVANPGQVGALVDLLRPIAQERAVCVALEPSGVYGDPLRQALADARVNVHRVSPKAAHDYAEVFDGVPSQHDGKDAAVVAELARLGKSIAWPWKLASPRRQQIEYWVDRMDASRRLMQMWCGRIEGRLARHWPEILPELKLTSPTLLGMLLQHGGPAPLAADPQGQQTLKRLSRNHLPDEKLKRIIDRAKQTIGVRQTAIDQQRLR